MSLYEALKGARVELAGIANPVAKTQRALGICRTFAQEILSQLLVIPYAIRALRTYHSLPRLQAASVRPADSVSLIQGVRYSQERPRNVLDVYVPPAHAVPSSGAGERGAAPVVLFCHGGVWATGDKWHYAPMAARLAGAGVLTLVMHYTLYPDALVPHMAGEVSTALSYTLDNAALWGGDPSRISLVGHSAGAQLAALAVMNRAQHAEGQAHQPAAHGPSDGRMPKRFIGMAGVYDLTKHFAYEGRRGVEELSTMKRAAGGVAEFPSVSPVVILARALQQDVEPQTRASAKQAAENNRDAGFSGEALSHRIGFERPRVAMSERLATVIDGETASPPLARQLTVAEARRLPPTVLMSSCADIIVPWYESAEMFWMLKDCGVKVKHLVYNFVGHGDFVVSWRTRKQPVERGQVDAGEDLEEVAQDLLAIVSEQRVVDYA